MTPDFSIIVPVYNSEQYLEKCINAVLSQGDYNYELILVNDGSPDNSLEICNAFAAKHSQIRVFSQENGGLCSARNKGIDNARGKYLLFIDNDDEIADNTLAVLHSWIEKKDYEIIRFNRKRIQTFDNGKTKTDIYGTKGICENGPVEVTSKEFFTDYRKFKNSGCFSGIWIALFRRELFENANIRFDTSITAGYEDFLVNIQAFRAAKNMLFLPDVLYVYFRRTSHSVSTTYKENQIYALKLVANAEKDMLAHIPYADVHEIYTSDVN
ncbi:MAG: glycosyltransferase family 2 protein, partial [Lachnospiraceae bacterium]|nr:glycosyltransferase family 2 protein [Lachnospiraceae bacterium]